MNILLSAYACEPNKGSEPGVGWSWAMELSKHHNVWVITRDNNQRNIEQYLIDNPKENIEQLHFIYVGLPSTLTFWKKGRRGMRLFYYLWQKKAVEVAKKWNEKVAFDLVQHVTFVSYTQPSFMHQLDIPFIWGPISGGENIPRCVKIKMSLKECLIEKIRNISQYLALISPNTKKCLKKSKYILVATNETKEMIPQKFHSKTKVIPAIGLDSAFDGEKLHKNSDISKIKIVMAGRLIYWKAFELGIMAFIKATENCPNIELHILGEGDQKQYLKKICGNYLDRKIYFDSPIEHDGIFKYYSGFDIFMNTTLRDSGCMTMMEAMSVGLPCVAISTGGPGVLLNAECGVSVLPKPNNILIDELADGLCELISNKRKRLQCGENAKTYAETFFLMSQKYEHIKKLYSI